MGSDTESNEIRKKIQTDYNNGLKEAGDQQKKDDHHHKSPAKGAKEKKGFDVDLICVAFEQFNREESLDHYIRGYKELSNFFENLGTIFSFVASDVDSKLVILENYRLDKEKGKHYADLQTMIDYERQENLLHNGKNGTRNLLRLHRALQFISEFLNNVTKLDEHEYTNSLAILAYERTLMKYHSWLISKAAKLAMYTLPTRSVLVQRVFHNNKEQMSRDQINESMLRISKLTEQAFNNCQRLYEENNLLDLP